MWVCVCVCVCVCVITVHIYPYTNSDGDFSFRFMSIPVCMCTSENLTLKLQINLITDDLVLFTSNVIHSKYIHGTLIHYIMCSQSDIHSSTSHSQHVFNITTSHAWRRLAVMSVVCPCSMVFTKTYTTIYNYIYSLLYQISTM